MSLGCKGSPLARFLGLGNGLCCEHNHPIGRNADLLERQRDSLLFLTLLETVAVATTVKAMLARLE